MNLLQLRYFYETAKNQSLTKTAEKYMVPASSVSASIKRLEQELNGELFHRTSNRITLNDKGKMFERELGEIFEKLDSAVEKIKEPEEGLPKINILVKARPKWIAELIVGFLAENPKVTFAVSNDYSATNLEDFDIVIDEASEKYDGWRGFLLSVEILCVKAAKHNKWVEREVFFEQLKEETFILPSRGNGMRKRYESLCQTLGFAPNVGIECNDRQLLQYYVESDMGLTIGAYRALADNTQNTIAPLTVLDFNETQEVYVFYKEQENRNRVLKRFCEFLYERRYTIPSR